MPLFEAFAEKLYGLYPATKMRVQKTQITFSNRHVFACVSFLRVKRKAELPDPYLVVTLGLSFPLASHRVAAKTEAYPGRWTTHIVIGTPSEIDSELMNCFKDTILKNDTVKGAEFPVFKSGVCTINCTGDVSRIEVIPRWCCL